MSLTLAIKAEAYRLGFLLAGVTTPDPPPHLAAYESWLEAGRHGEMGYLATPEARQRRADPRRILPECQSILVLAAPYYPPHEAEPHKGQGRVAAYAWGLDYHEVLVERLKQLTGFISLQAGREVPNRYYTDTGPILERGLAQRAGLGWIGKNTLLINPQYGSYFFLAEILLGLELEPDPPIVTDHCGSCMRCLEACPTACILLDRTIDARRCISYLTIELKGAIPEALRSQMGEWTFGCDVCQQVCPWNQRFAPSEGDPAFAPRTRVPLPDLASELRLTPETFNQKFRGSPVKRARRRGYLRNSAVALGNTLKGTGNPEAVKALIYALQADPEPLVREHAAWALGQVGGDRARQALHAALETEGDQGVQAEIRQALE